jgi:hypothetical protein
MCEVRSREKRAGTKKKKYNGQQQKEMDCHEPHSVPNEKIQPIQWTERPTGALVAVNSLWPTYCTYDSCLTLINSKEDQHPPKKKLKRNLSKFKFFEP